MRKSYLSDIKYEQFEEIRPLFESTHKKTAIQHGVSSLSYWRMARTPGVPRRPCPTTGSGHRGYSASKTCGAKPRATDQPRVEGVVVTRAHSLNRPLRTRMVGGVGAKS